ncbi:MAG: DNA repair exonuclease [Methanomicrobiaceae archaeon]|nr:DNA repair exonuclease [Methanomicrobiaceae archaeon]
MPVKKSTSKAQNNSLLKFVHTADLHLGSPLASRSVKEEAVASRLIRATFEGFENIIELCIREDVDFLLISGDIYDSADREIYEQLTFRKYLKRLSDAGMPVYLAFGNHDPLDGWAARIDWPRNVHIMSGDEPECAFFKGRDGRETVIVGMSYRTRETYDNLAVQFPQKEKDWPFTIGMLHCTLDTGFGHEPYSPCLVSDLVERGYDYWALGHIHKPGVIRESRPAIVYPGNPQGRDIGESGPRGCYLVSVDSKYNAEIRFIETAPILWEEAEVSIEGIEMEGDLLERIHDTLTRIRRNSHGTAVLCRLTLTGRGRVHAALVREGTVSQIIQSFRDDEVGKADFVLIERIVDRTEAPIDRERIAQRADIVGDVVQITDSILSNDEALLALQPMLAELFEGPKGREYIIGPDLEELRELVRVAEIYLLDQFVGDESS